MEDGSEQFMKSERVEEVEIPSSRDEDFSDMFANSMQIADAPVSSFGSYQQPQRRGRTRTPHPAPRTPHPAPTRWSPPAQHLIRHSSV
jgi:hypothetical protein